MDKQQRLCKKGLSGVVVTVLLVLITVSVALFVASFVVPFVKNSLSSGKACYYSNGKFIVEDDLKYSCFDEASNEVRLMISNNGKKEVDYKSIKVNLIDETESKNFDLSKEGKMYDGSELRIPGKEDALTYNLSVSFVPNTAKIYVVLENDKLCLSDTFSVGSCVE